MADVPTYREVREAYLEMAERYDVMARQADALRPPRAMPSSFHATSKR
jgi:hypothetical protein